MEIILTKQCESVQGTLNTKLGYFIAQRDLANGKKTMKAYLWKVCGDEYDAEHPRA